MVLYLLYFAPRPRITYQFLSSAFFSSPLNLLTFLFSFLMRLLVLQEWGSHCSLPVLAHTSWSSWLPLLLLKVVAGSRLRLFEASPPLPCFHSQLSAGGSREHNHRKTEVLGSQWSCAASLGELNLQMLMSCVAHPVAVAVASPLPPMRTSPSRTTLLPTVALHDLLPPCLLSLWFHLFSQTKKHVPHFCRGVAPQEKWYLCLVTRDLLFRILTQREVATPLSREHHLLESLQCYLTKSFSGRRSHRKSNFLNTSPLIAYPLKLALCPGDAFSLRAEL